jgi:hydrogenase maturation protease
VTLRARVVGLGQPVAGDDGVGVAVIVRLRAEGEIEGVLYETIADASTLVERLQAKAPIVIVDAVVGGGEVGDVVVLEPRQLGKTARPLSSHGISVAQAIELARALAPDAVPEAIRIVGIVIAEPKRGMTSLSPAVAAAVSRAAAVVREQIEDFLEEAWN